MRPRPSRARSPAAPSTPATLRDVLRTATSAAHARLERLSALDPPAVDRPAYAAWLARMLAFLAPLEDALARLPWATIAVDFEGRRRAHLLVADLAALGEPRLARTSTDLPRLDGLAAGLGCLYVLEGSTLGGRVLVAKVAPALGLTVDHGCRFLATGGADVPARWRSLLEVLEACDGRMPRARVVAGAEATFDAIERALGRTGGRPR